MISVCMATFNGAAFVVPQLQSILSQLGDGDEVIISDDGSVDGTLERVAALADPRVRVISGHASLGVVGNFDRALGQARGDYIFLSDQDDVWLPGKVNRCVEMLQTQLMVVTDCAVVDEYLVTIMPSFFRYRRSGSGFWKNLWKNSYLGCCMAFRREVLLDAIPIPRNVAMHDIWLGMIAELKGEVVFLPESLSLYRRHSGNASFTSEKSRYSWLQRLKFRSVLLWLLMQRFLIINKRIKS